MEPSSISSLEKMNRGKYSEHNKHLGEEGERWTRHILRNIRRQNGIRFRIINNCNYFGDANLDHVIEFPNGDFLVLDSKNWLTRLKPYLKRELGKLQHQMDFVKQKHHTKRVYGGLVCYRKNIPNGIRESGEDKYLIRPQYLKEIISNLSKK